MKKFLCLILSMIMVLSAMPFLAFGAGPSGGSKFIETVGNVFMTEFTPTVDGTITSKEMGKNSFVIDYSNMSPMVDIYEGEVNAKVCFSFDENNLYICADIVDEDYVYCEGYSYEDPYPNSHPKGTNFFGFDGDEFIFSIDPYASLFNEGRNLFSDMSGWFCFGLFEDGHMEVYRTWLGEGDLTDVISAKGQRTAKGWCFEAAIPFDTIAEDLYYSSFNACQFDKAKMLENGAQNRANIILVDRNDIDCVDNIYSTSNKQTALGLDIKYNTKPSVGTYGITLIPARDGYTYVPVDNTKKEVTFSDVKSTSWYYDAVTRAVHKGFVSGYNDGTFKPKNNLTRAMAVTIISGYAKYDGTCDGEGAFNDVTPSKYYFNEVDWAYKNGITSGTGDKIFSPGTDVTRQDFVCFLYKLAQFKKYKIEPAQDNVLDTFSDKDKVSSYAREAVRWAVANGIMAGSNGYLNPKGTVTRAEAVQFVCGFDKVPFTHFVEENALNNISICGNDISLYTIIYGGESQDKDAAGYLVDYINRTCGITLNTARDIATPVGDYEILVGTTNRENDNFSVDRTDVSEEGYAICTHENKLYIVGGPMLGTVYGAYWFIEEYLGFVFTDNVESRMDFGDINIEDGIYVVRNSMMQNLAWSDKTSSKVKKKYGLYGERLQSDDGYQCGLQWIMDGNWDNYGAKNPCFSDPEIMQEFLTKLDALMARQPNKKVFSLGTYDNNYYCMCDRCQEIYREEGSRAGTYVRLVNYLIENLTPKYPYAIFYVGAYDFTIDPPKSKLPDNVYLRFINISSCFHHPINDPDCPINRVLYKKILGWREKVNVMWMGEHGTTFAQYLIPVMNYEFMYNNIKFYGDIDICGMFYWGNANTNGEFCLLRNYLMAHMFWNNKMTRDEYQVYMESFLEGYYGPSWKNILEYLEEMNVLQDGSHFASRPTASMTIDMEGLAKQVGYFDDLWFGAFDAAEGQRKDNLEKSMASYLYIRNSSIYDSQYVNGTPEQKTEYMSMNERLYEILQKYSITWSEQQQNPSIVDYSLSPMYWS